MNNNIFILSDKIRTGKTSVLLDFISRQSSIGGFLTPDINGLRNIYFLADKTYHEFQIPEQHDGIKVGKFNFSHHAFEKAKNELTKITFQDFDWIIIDEIGKLELLKVSGFEPSLSNFIERFKNYSGKTKLLLVVRDSLLQLAFEFYKIENATIINQDYLKNYKGQNNLQNPLTGIVLCGGNSTRMGYDKFLINYYGIPHYQYLIDLIKSIGLNVFISANSNQLNKIENSTYLIIDNDQFLDAGPMTGLLSAFEKSNGNAILLVGCDYPLLAKEHLLHLVNNRDQNFDAVCYMNDQGIIEPLIAIYEYKIFEKLRTAYLNKETSLRIFLNTINTKIITYPHNKFLHSADNMNEKDLIFKYLQSK